MDITITINTDNAAFEDNPDAVVDILQNVIDRIKTKRLSDSDLTNFIIWDTNGSPAGDFKVS